MIRVIWLLAGGALLLGLTAAYLFQAELEPLIVTGWTTPSLKASADIPPDIAFHLLVTAGRSSLILLLGSGCAASLTLIALQAKSASLGDALTMASSIPPLVWVPLCIALFGLREEAFVGPGIVFTAAFIAPGILTQIHTAPQPVVEMLQVLGRDRRDIGRVVVVPHVLVGLAPLVALTFALLFGMSSVVEYLGGFNGVGRVLRSMTFSYEVRGLLSITVAVTLALWGAQTLLRRAMVGAASLL